MSSVVLILAAVVVVFCLGALFGSGYTTTAQLWRGKALARRRRVLIDQAAALRVGQRRSRDDL